MNIAVFIDAENVAHTQAKNIVTEVKEHGRIITSNIYGDWSKSNMASWMSVAALHGLTCIQCDRLNKKNSTDIKLMLDMLKMLYTNAIIDVFFIVTSDSDYRHIVTEVKLKGKKCFCIGSNQTNSSLQNSCDKFIKIENLTTRKQGLDQMMLADIKRLMSEEEAICMSKLRDEWTKKYQFDHRERGFHTFSAFLFGKFGNILKKIEIGHGSKKITLKS